MVVEKLAVNDGFVYEVDSLEWEYGDVVVNSHLCLCGIARIKVVRGT